MTPLLVGACDRADRAAVDTALGAAGDTIGALAGRVAGAEYTNAELVGFVNTYNDAETAEELERKLGA